MKCLALTLVLIAAACADEGDVMTTTMTAPVPVIEGPDVRLPLLPPSAEGPLVGAPGTLEVDGPCLYLRALNGTRTLPLFATFDTRWNRAAGVLEIGDRTFRPGETVTLGGGPLGAPPANMTWVQSPDPRCRADQAFIVYSISTGAT